MSIIRDVLHGGDFVSKLVRDVVHRGIREFERDNPGWKLNKQAVRMLQARGAKHQLHIAEEVKSKRTSKAALVEGLRFLLEQSISIPKSKARRGYWVGNAGENIAHRRNLTDRSIQRQISVSALRMVMKKKCKTFPWC